tara:strand:+ start:165 stop:653 length:489 start_codon:yes stop_codon:yes gene_type:complete
MNLSLLLIGPKYVRNLGFCLRTAELANVSPVFIYDEYSLLSYSQRPSLMRSSARALRNHNVQEINDHPSFLRGNTSRKIATVVDPNSKNLFEFDYGEDDLLVFGDEHSGLEEGVIEQCDERVTIPQYNRKHKNAGKIQCYTLVSAVDMFIYEFMRQRHFAEQ